MLNIPCWAYLTIILIRFLTPKNVLIYFCLQKQIKLVNFLRNDMQLFVFLQELFYQN